MGFFRKLGGAIRQAFRGDTTRREQVRHTDDGTPKRSEPDYSHWEELDDLRLNFFLGGWVTRKIRQAGRDSNRKEAESRAREQAAAEGREYKSPLQLELEAVARKREEKERRKEEKRREKEARKRGS